MADAVVALPQSRRPDGSLRPQVRVKKGYVPAEEQQTYADAKGLKAQPVGVPGADDGGVHIPKPPKSKSAHKNEKRKQKKVEGGADENGVVDVSEGAPAKGGATPRSAAAPPVAEEPAEGQGQLEKKLRALRKKLKAIDDLAAKAAEGAELNADQAAKVAARGEIEAEISKWEAYGDPEEVAKEVKKLGKKIRQIEELEAKAAEGAELNADQQGKIVSKPKLLEEVSKLEELMKQL